MSVATRVPALHALLWATFFLVLALPGCAGCENTVCCALPGRALTRVLRPSQCSAMGGVAALVSMCEVICCEEPAGTYTPGSRATCRGVVDPSLCDTPDGG